MTDQKDEDRPRRFRGPAPPGTTPLAWQSTAVGVAVHFSEWRASLGVSLGQLADWMSRPPFQTRPGDVSIPWLGQLLRGELKRAPYPQELAAYACLTHNLFNPFLTILEVELDYRLTVPTKRKQQRGLVEAYEYIWLKYGVLPEGEWLTIMGAFFEQYRKALTS